MRYPTMIIGESRSETQSQREERFSLLAFGFSLRANSKTQSRFSPRSGASSFDDPRIHGLGRKLERPIPAGWCGSVVSEYEFLPAQTPPAVRPRPWGQGAVPRDSE